MSDPSTRFSRQITLSAPADLEGVPPDDLRRLIEFAEWEERRRLGWESAGAAPDAYGLFSEAVKNDAYYKVVDLPIGQKLQEGEATREQATDVHVTLVSSPLSSWRIFKAGWDAAVLRQPKEAP